MPNKPIDPTAIEFLAKQFTARQSFPPGYTWKLVHVDEEMSLIRVYRPSRELNTTQHAILTIDNEDVLKTGDTYDYDRVRSKKHADKVIRDLWKQFLKKGY